MTKTGNFSALSKVAKRLLRCRDISLASNPWRDRTELIAVEFPSFSNGGVIM